MAAPNALVDKVDPDEALVYGDRRQYLDDAAIRARIRVEGVDAQINSKQIDTYHVTDETSTIPRQVKAN